jgi:hypothetical protein
MTDEELFELQELEYSLLHFHRCASSCVYDDDDWDEHEDDEGFIIDVVDGGVVSFHGSEQ